MIRRAQLNGRKSKIAVFKRFPTLDLNKNYTLKIENLYLPPIDDGLVFDRPLFSIIRRAKDGERVTRIRGVLEPQLAIPDSTFTPRQVRTMPELLFQINAFLRRFLSKIRSGQIPFPADDDIEDTPAIFAPLPNADWYDVMLEEKEQDGVDGLQAVSHDNGRVSFLFSADVQKFLVLRFTEDGQRIFGTEQEFVAPNSDGTFVYARDLNGENIVAFGPSTSDDEMEVIFKNNVFAHEDLRHEIFINTTLPVTQYIECNGHHAQYETQLVAYRYPRSKTSSAYSNIMYKRYTIENTNRLCFEHNNRTHNVFRLTGSELQNFHIDIQLRRFKYDEATKQFNITVEEYPIHNDQIWTIMLAVTDG